MSNVFTESATATVEATKEPTMSNVFTESATATVEATTFDAGLIEALFTESATAMAALDAAESNAVEVRAREITRIMDSMRLHMNVPMAQFLKGNAKTNPARADIKVLFEALTADGVLGDLSPNTASMYASNYWLCFEEGIPFDVNARNKKVATAKLKGTSTKKVDVEKYGKELVKVLSMARMLQRSDDAAALLDMIIEIDPEFVEA
jgi:hypothetical protein